MKTLTPLRTQADFAVSIEREFIDGSAIAPDLYAVSVQIVSDTEPLPGGDVAYPIHEALGWHLTRFGFQARATLYAALLLNEDGSTWQVKLSTPRVDRKKTAKKGTTQYQKYESVLGNGSRAFLPTINRETRRKIAQRYGCEAPPCSASFWNWLEQHPEIPIVLTEGGKKALCLLSLGYVAISLYGINGGYRVKDDAGNSTEPYLIPDIARFIHPDRCWVLAFDQDSKLKTRYEVERALAKFGRLLEAAGGEVEIASWQPEQGKGVDDLIVAGGAVAWEFAYTYRRPLLHWQIWQRLKGQLTDKPSIRLKTADLSTLELPNLPDRGIIAIASAKGTGKTKFTGTLIQGTPKALLAGHRICLMRNLCERLNVDYRGDLDKAGGRFFNGSAYTLRVGLCVDSLLAIDPTQFHGCTLVIDEVVQVLRHLLTSSTCRKDGKLPALLARLHQLIQAADRVIVADADLNNAVLDYLRSLRDDSQPVYLIQNDYQPQGYKADFIQCSNASAVIARLLKDLQQRQPGQVFFVATDSKAGSKTLGRLVRQLVGLRLRVLVLNSETSGGEIERAFIQNPDVLIRNFDVIVASPSLATGVSIEAHGLVAKVYGLFYGASSTDADIAQALGRVREPVDRIVWCAQRGSNFSKVSRSTNPLELKSQLKLRTDTTVSLIRSQLREDIAEDYERYDWQSDPHLNLWSRISAEQNYSMLNLRDALLVRLRYEGHQVTVIDTASDTAAKLLIRQANAEIKQMDASEIAQAPALTLAEVELLKDKESLTPEERLALARFNLTDFYATEDVTSELALWDNNGRRRGELLNLEALLYSNLAIERDIKTLQKQARWNQGLCPWDIGSSELRRKLREAIGLTDFLTPDQEWTAADLQPYADTARQLAREVKVTLHLTIDRMSDTQVIHQLLSQLGVKTVFRWRGTGENKQRVYRLDAAQWQQLTEVLERRKLRRKPLEKSDAQGGSPLPVMNPILTGDPSHPPQEPDDWLAPECLAEVRSWLDSAQSPEQIAEIRAMIPLRVWEAVGWRNSA